jgi:cell division protein FtsW
MILSKKLEGDKVIWSIVLLLSILSVLVVYSSTGTLAYKYQNGNTEFYMIKHLSTIVMALVIMYFVHKLDSKYYKMVSKFGILVAIPLLIYTLVKGTNLNEASRWIRVPVINLTFQTSDFAKLVLIMYISRMLALKQENLNDLKTGFLPVVIPVIIVCVIILPANFSTAAMLFATCFVLMFIGRVYWKHLLSLVGLGVAGILLIIMVANFAPKLVPRFATWQKRVESFKSGSDNEKDNFQSNLSKIAIASGGVIGKGPGKSIQRNFLPHPYSDFIFAIIIEEYGMVSGLILLLLYSVLLYRGFRILAKSQKTFGALMAFGLSFSLVFQAMINMAVAVNLFPVTGQPLPMLSMGGSSLWITSISIGLILNVSKEVEQEQTKLQEA